MCCVKKLEKKVINIKEYMLHAEAMEGSFEVHRGEDRYIVDLVGKSCTCYSWQLTGLPCSHGLACIFHDRDNYENYVDKFYYKSNWIACYGFSLQPIHGEKEWPRVDVPQLQPPVYTKQPGRPKKMRKGDAYELVSAAGKLSKKGIKMSCRKCGGLDHNAKTCKQPHHTQVISNISFLFISSRMFIFIYFYFVNRSKHLKGQEVDL